MDGSEVIEWLLKNASGPSILLAAILSVLRWLRPRAEKLFDGHIELVEHLVEGLAQNNEIIPVLTSFLRESYRRMRSHRTTILIVEDSLSDRRLIENHLHGTAVQHGLILAAVSSIQDAIPLVTQSMVIVLDVMLEGTTHPETTHVFSRIVSAPVIVFTGLDDQDRLRGLNVVRKNGPDGYAELVKAVEAAIVDGMA